MGGIANTALTALPMVGRVQQVVGGIQNELQRGQRERQAERQAEQQREAERQHALNVLTQRHALERRQLAQDQEAAMQASQADIDRRRAELDMQAAADREDRRNSLETRLSRSRASLGARGVGTADGSGAALLRGLVEEADRETRNAAAADGLKVRALDQDIDNRKRRNLLELSQLADRQKLELYSRGY